MPATTEQTNFSIQEAKSALLEGMEEHPRWPAVDLVRRLGLAYLGPEPDTTEQSTVRWSGVQGYGPWNKLLRRTVSQVSRLDVEGSVVDIRLRTTTDHDKRLLIPGITSLGSLAFKSTPAFQPLERLEVSTPETTVSLEVSPGSEMQIVKMAEMLLSLPDYPHRLSAIV